MKPHKIVRQIKSNVLRRQISNFLSIVRMESSILLRFAVISNALFIIFATSSTPAPSFAPTPIPTPVLAIQPQQRPIAPHQLIVVPATGYSLIQLKFYDTSTTLVSFFIVLRFVLVKRFPTAVSISCKFNP